MSGSSEKPGQRAQLQHPNIVTIYELGNFGSNEKPYIVMEYLEGADLAGLIRMEKTVPFSEALDITIQLCKALDFAHQKRVVHRDMKPSNVRWMDDGTVKIMDFGIARIEDETQITKSGMLVGTIHYMSPEQVRGENIDGRSDIFSTACILYEMLAGTRPFVGESATSVLYQIVNEPTPQILEDHPELPQEIEAILSKGLAKKTEDRYRSAGEMARDLEKLLEVYRKTLRRPSTELQERLNELEAMRREGRWSDVVPLAKTLVNQNPTLEGPHRALRTGLRQLQQEEEERRATPDERTRHFAEISREFAFLRVPLRAWWRFRHRPGFHRGRRGAAANRFARAAQPVGLATGFYHPHRGHGRPSRSCLAKRCSRTVLCCRQSEGRVRFWSEALTPCQWSEVVALWPAGPLRLR